MHQSVFVPIAECYVSYVQGLMQNYSRVGSLTGNSLSTPTGRGKVVYVLPFSDPTFALLLMRFTKYEDDHEGRISYNLFF
ncbi:hypothetical protein Hanom_Chr16g01461571 [Helianthus anomalus]